MDERNLEKALEIVSALISGEEVGRGVKKNLSLYDSYESSSEVYELVHKILKSFNINLYEYKESLYITARRTGSLGIQMKNSRKHWD